MKHVEYLTCPFCSRNMLLSKIDVENMAMFDKDPGSEWFVFQVREARGREEGNVKAAGFYLVPKESKTILQMLDDKRLKPYALGVIARLEAIIRSYVKAGLMEKPIRKGETEQTQLP